MQHLIECLANIWSGGPPETRCVKTHFGAPVELHRIYTVDEKYAGAASMTMVGSTGPFELLVQIPGVGSAEWRAEKHSLTWNSSGAKEFATDLTPLVKVFRDAHAVLQSIFLIDAEPTLELAGPSQIAVFAAPFAAELERQVRAEYKSVCVRVRPTRRRR